MSQWDKYWGFRRHRSAGTYLTLDDSQLGDIARALAGTEKEVEVALKRALNRTAQWLQTRARRALMKGLNLPANVIRARLRYAYYSATAKRVRVWIGLNPVSVIRLNPKKSAKGVTARGEKYDGGFITTGRSGNRHVYKRLGKERFPIMSVYKDISEGKELLENQVFEGWEQFLLERFEHELKWQGGKKA